MVEPEIFQAGVERATDRIRREVFVPDLCRDMQLLAREARCRNGGTDGLLVAVHFRGVDMAVAKAERTFDRRATNIALHAKSAEPEPRQADALGLQMFHDDLPFGIRTRRMSFRTPAKGRRVARIGETAYCRLI